ncbi:hypothetical protein JHD50_07910 [Sulfurimonas sp. MAG313]|nr:hypothetical protein [Sulfurimonas sp. MAG313]MDF1881226.1 hypothetical protein [Sulfurimonas sp. MAG313]
MYYVVQILHDAQDKHFISYQVPKYILSEKNTNIIFEFGEKPNIKRKWAAKKDIILLTKEKTFFQAFEAKLIKLEESHLDKINNAQEKLVHLQKQYQEQMHSELNSFKELSEKNPKVPTLI